MTIYSVSVRANYYEDIEIEADSQEEAYKLAVQTFEPCGDNCMSIDVYGLSPWEPDSPLEDILHDQYKQRELDGD